MPALLSALTLAASAVCPAPVEVPVFFRDGAWVLEAASERAVADLAVVAAVVPAVQVSVTASDPYRGNPAVQAVGDVLARNGVTTIAIVISTGPRAGISSLPPMENPMTVKIVVDCRGPAGG